MGVCPSCGAFMGGHTKLCVSCSVPSERVLIDGRYAVEKELGRGAMGVVFQARDVGLDRLVALKLIEPALARNPVIVSNFLREAKTLAAVRCEHVVQVYSFGPHEQSFFFAMEFVQGATLESLIQDHADNGARLPLHRAVAILRRVGTAIDLVHAAGIVHRDIKPENVVIEARTGRPVLVDFGLALYDDEADRDVTIAGTPPYMPPEALTGTGLPSASADIYAFACSAYEVFTAVLPFDGASVAEIVRKVLLEPPPALSSLRRDLAALDPVFDSALSKDPAARQRSCGEIVGDIERLVLSRAPPRRRTSSGAMRLNLQGELSILIVDDDPVFSRLAARAVAIVFQGVPVQIKAFASGQQALDYAAVTPPRLVLLDQDLSGMDGVTTLSLLRESDGGMDARVVVIADEGRAREDWRFAALGATDFLPKPVTFVELVTTLDGIAKSSGWQLGEVPSSRRGAKP